MQYITVIADILVKKEDIEYLKYELYKLINPTINEYGCVLYEFYQDINNPCFFHSYEKWINMDSINKHLNSNHIKEYLYNTKNIVTHFDIKYFKNPFLK